jgi:hypothetical protein
MLKLGAQPALAFVTARNSSEKPRAENERAAGEMDVLGVGIAAVDVICEVDAYPQGLSASLRRVAGPLLTRRSAHVGYPHSAIEDAKVLDWVRVPMPVVIRRAKCDYIFG